MVMTFAPVNRISAERTVVQEFKRERGRDFPPESVREPPVQFCLHLDLNVFMSFFAQGYEGRGRPFNFRIAHRHIEFPVEASHPRRTVCSMWNVVDSKYKTQTSLHEWLAFFYLVFKVLRILRFSSRSRIC